jgi:ankyrin repeat protein
MFAYAIEKGDINLVQRCILLGANINGKAGSGRTFLWLAATSGHDNIVKLFIDNHIDLFSKNIGFRALQGAAESGHPNVVRLLLDAGVPPEVSQKPHFTKDNGPLYFAVCKGHESVVRLLLEYFYPMSNLEQSINVNAQMVDGDGDGYTALMISAKYDFPKVVEILLHHGAEINALSTNNLTALGMACQNCNHDSVKLLLNSAATTNTSILGSNTALYWAAMCDFKNESGDSKQLEIVRLLLEHGAQIDQRMTPLLHTMQDRKPRLLRLLLENDADINMHTAAGVRPLLLAAETNEEQVPHGETALHRAFLNNNRSRMKLLLGKGVYPNFTLLTEMKMKLVYWYRRWAS